MDVSYDQVEGAALAKTPNGIEITRPCMVTDIDGDTSVAFQNPAILTDAITVLPAQFTPHPTYPNALLEDFRVRSIVSTDAVIVDLIYRQRIDADSNHASASIWSLEDATQGSHVTTYATADGSKTIKVWYKSAGALGAPPGEDTNPPTKAMQRVAGVHRWKSHAVLTATALLKGDDWNSWKAQVRAARGKIHSDQWGEAKRGTWLFVGPTARYTDRRRKVVQVRLTFLEDPELHYPIAAYFDERGIHPADCDTEKTLRGNLNTPPPVNAIRRVNGLTIASVQNEVPFGPIFAFTPDL